MISTLFLIVFVSFVYHIFGMKNDSCECGLSNGEINRRIVGGEVTAPYEYPWVVALFKHDGKLHCGGSIISRKHILTAGHCIASKVKPTDLYAYIGMHDREADDNLMLRIVEGIIHPSFSSNAVRDANDIAILTLESEIKFSDRIRPICLPKQSGFIDLFRHYENKTLYVAGWGRIGLEGPSSRYLLHAKVRLTRIDNCRRHAIYKFNVIPNSMFCAYAEGKDACQGDSGGPLFFEKEPQRFEQIGIVSWGLDCAKKEFPGIYTKLPNYVDWVKEMTADGTNCTA